MRRPERHEGQSIGNDAKRWWAAPFFLILLGGLLVWAAFPPIGFSWLAWLAPVPWLLLVRKSSLPGRHPWLQIWLGGVIPWLVLLEGIRRAHFANNFGWLALSLYLAAYFPAFIAMTRAAVHRARVPLILAAPVVWVALEFVRGKLLTGFSMGLLGHTQFELAPLIQIADLFGAYGVSFLLILVAACVVTMLPSDGTSWRRWPALVAICVVTAALGYGAVRIQSTPAQLGKSRLNVALLQGTRDKIFEFNRTLDEQSFAQYWNLMLQAKQQHSDVDLIIWPEAAFTSLSPELLVEGPLVAPPEYGISDSEFTDKIEAAKLAFLDRARQAAQAVNGGREGALQDGVYLLVGAETNDLKRDLRQLYNSALLLNPEGRVVDRYYKIHPVMFGEYIPFGDWFPWLYQLTPMSQGLSRGEAPQLFEVKGFKISPNVCFEVTVPHLIRRGFCTLAEKGDATPDVLVNVTDDGWFWGSTVLDLQLACAVFRAVELRRPMLIAANTGISAVIDGNGRILERSPKRQEDILYAEVARDGRDTLYCRWGDLPAWLCVVASLIWGFKSRRPPK